MMTRLLTVASVLAALFVNTICFSQPLPEPKSGLSIERLYDFPIINGRSPAGEKMSPDGSKIVYGWNETGERRRDVWVMDFPSGRSRMILDTSSIERPYRQDDERTDLQKEEEALYDSGLASFQWSPDGREIMTGSYRGRVWLMKPDGSDLRPLFDTNEQVSGARYSPDGKYIGFIRSNNVFTYDRSSGSVKQITFISKSGTAIGGFKWSPDSKNIAVDWADKSKLGKHVMMDFSKDRAEVVNITRMWHGDKSWNAQTGIVPVEGGKIKWLSDIPRYNWKVAEEWSPDGKMYAIGWISEDFQEYTISVVHVKGMLFYNAYKETAPKNYIPDFRKLLWSRDSKRILFTTDIQEGEFTNRSLFSMDAFGRNIEQVYVESHDIAGVARAKDSDRIVLVTQARSPLMTEITIIEPDGSRTVHVPMENGVGTRVQFDNCAPPLMSDDGTRIATMASSPTQPWELFAVEPRAKRLTSSPLPEFDKIEWAEYKQVTFEAEDGRTIYGLLVTPKGMDASKKRPAFLGSMYANSAKMAWKGYFSNYAAEELGMVTLFLDFASSWGQGGERNSEYYKAMGVIDTREAVAAKAYLDSLGFVREDRVGVWGWSYGGFLTNMIMLTAPGVFDTGVAVAPVTDWFTYNEWYTRRRLGMQEDDEEIYKTTSPVHHAAGLEGNLFLIHGMLDDNVLFQDTVRLMQNLIDEGKYFDVMTYPRDDHGIGKATSRPHVFATIMRYLYWKLSRE